MWIKAILIVLAIVIILLVGSGLWWRRTSRSHSLPCPWWFSWFLESSLMERFGRTQLTLDRIGLRPGQRVLEVGPGPGRLLIPAARRVLPGGEAAGVDIQPGMIDRLKKRARQAGVSNLTAISGDATKPHFQPESFDVVYLCTVLGEIPDREAALKQCHAALKPGGMVSFTEIFPDPHYQSRSTVRGLAETAGFCFKHEYGSWLSFTMNFVKPNGDVSS